MAFDKTKPASTTTWGNLYSILRDQFNALASHHAGGSSPSSPDTGWVWFDTATGLFKYYTGSAWASLSSALAEVAEVIAARGSKTTLDARLDVSLNEDGTLKAGVSGGNEWVDPALTPTYVSGVSFTVAGEQTDIYMVNRRLKATLTGGARYGTVKTAVYGAPNTTVTLHEVTDSAGASATLDATLSKVEHAFCQTGHRGSDPRRPLLNAVASLGALPTANLLDGDLCAVLSEDTVYQWDSGDSAWAPVGRTALFCYAAATPNLTVKVHHGMAMINGSLVEKTTAATSGAVTAPTGNPRIDLLVMDYAGALSWVTGAESASPVPPAYPADKLALCEVFLRVSSAAIYNTDQGTGGYIKRDVRPFLLHQPRSGGITEIQDVSISSNATNPNYQMDVSFKCRVNGVEKTFSGVADLSTTGALGRDTGSEAASAWYGLHVLAKEDGTLTVVWRRETIEGTNTSATASKLVDSGAAFVTNLVAVGDRVINKSTGVSATVTAVDSETQLSLSADIFTSSPKSYQVVLGRAPTFPSGYIYHDYIGSARNNASSNLLPMEQTGKLATLYTYVQDLSAGVSASYVPLNLTVPPRTAAVRAMTLAGASSIFFISLDGTNQEDSYGSTAGGDWYASSYIPLNRLTQQTFYKRQSGSGGLYINTTGWMLK